MDKQASLNMIAAISDAYGAPGFFRMCVASPVRCVQKALRDLENAWKERS